MMCMVHNPVGVSGNTGRVDFEESCEVVDYQLKSGLEVHGQQHKNARMSVSEGWKLFEKNIPRAATAIYPTLSVALELEAQSKYRLCNPHFVPRGPPRTGCATCISFPRGNEDSWAFSTNFRTKSTFRSIQFSLIFSA